MRHYSQADAQERLDKLEALENGGADNWEWYGESIEDWEKDMTQYITAR